ncbi:WD40-repeat-containing domain protein [Lentinula edodes]|nr:WD40-repeat-containing domain protein [Lentinula edodes]
MAAQQSEPVIYGDFAYASNFTLLNPHFIYNAENIQVKLQEKLQPVQGAWLDTDRICMEGTRVGIIKEISDWINSSDPDASRAYFLCGEAGTGKSTISHTIGKIFQQHLGAFFGFSRTFARERTPSNALRTIAYDLSIRFSDIEQGLLKALQDNPHILGSANLRDLWNVLIVGPAKMLKNPFTPVVIIIDALDECDSQEKDGPRDKLLSLLINNTNELPRNFHVLVTTRLESDVIVHLESASEPHVQYMSKISNTNEDIFKYVCHQMMNGSKRGMLKEDQCKILAERAEGFFQWAYTVCKSLHGQGKAGMSVNKRFQRFITLGPADQKDLQALDRLYMSILNDVFDPEDEEAMNSYRQVVSQLLAAFQPLSQTVLKRLQLAGDVEEDDESNVEYVLPFLGSLLTGVDGLDAPVKPVHASVRDFLLDSNRSKQFVVDLKEGHTTLAKGTLNIMVEDLHFNMCDLENSYILNSEVKDLHKKILKGLSMEILYACCFWDLHLEKLEQKDWCLPILQKFFYNYSLFWIETLSLTRNMHVASRAATIIRKIIGNAKGAMNDNELQDFVQEIRLFVQGFGKMITDSTPHLYLSGIPFLPRGSRLITNYAEKFKNVPVISKGHKTTWPQQQASLQGHTGQVSSVAFSTNGERIISGSWDKSIRIWNGETGEIVGNAIKTAMGVNAVAFSPDCKKIVIGSSDSSVIIWDVESEKICGHPLQGHTHQVSSVAFSPDGRKIISGSWDKSVRVWSAQTGMALFDALQGHTKGVKSVTFSPNGQTIVSGSDDFTIRVWDAETGKAVGHPLQGHTNEVTSVACSPCGKMVASGSADNSVRMWNIETGEPVGGSLQKHTNTVTYIAFSPDGTRIASASFDNTIIIWNVVIGEPIGRPLQGHIDAVSSLAFSPDGKRIVSGSWDKLVRIWNLESNEMLEDESPGHKDGITSIVFSPNGKRIVSGSLDNSAKIWDADTGHPVGNPLLGHSNYILAVVCSPNGKKLVTGSLDHSVRIWDTETQEAIGNPLQGHTKGILCISFSPDGKTIASGSLDNSIIIWNAESGNAVGNQLNEHTGAVSSVAFSPNGEKIISGSWDKTIRIWNRYTGEAVGDCLQGHTNGVTSVAFSPDGQKLISGSFDCTLCIWDLNNEDPKPVVLQGHKGIVTSVAFSPDGNKIASASEDHSIRIWNVETGSAIGVPLWGHSRRVNAIAFSPNGKMIASGSLDKSLLISQDGLCILDLSHFKHGTDWKECFTGYMQSNVPLNLLVKQQNLIPDNLKVLKCGNPKQLLYTLVIMHVALEKQVRE